MQLFAHEQAILQAADHFRSRGWMPAIIEKDYYVTEALRVIAATAGDKVIFKGGTSLAKSWNLIQRFSEDIDIFLDPAAFQPPLGKNAIGRALRQLRDAVAAHPALTFVPGESQTIGGFGRNDRFAYQQRFGGPGEVASRVLVEAGTASGREPTTAVELRSHLGQFLQERGVSLGAEDEGSFPCGSSISGARSSRRCSRSIRARAAVPTRVATSSIQSLENEKAASGIFSANAIRALQSPCRAVRENASQAKANSSRWRNSTSTNRSWPRRTCNP
jgi:hypothetical protein